MKKVILMFTALAMISVMAVGCSGRTSIKEVTTEEVVATDSATIITTDSVQDVQVSDTVQ